MLELLFSSPELWNLIGFPSSSVQQRNYLSIHVLLTTVNLFSLASSLFGGFRRWVQAVFHISDGSNSSSSKEAVPKASYLDSDNNDQKVKEDNVNGLVNDSTIDLSHGVAFDMFGVSPSVENEVRLSLLAMRLPLLLSSVNNCVNPRSPFLEC